MGGPWVLVRSSDGTIEAEVEAKRLTLISRSDETTAQADADENVPLLRIALPVVKLERGTIGAYQTKYLYTPALYTSLLILGLHGIRIVGEPFLNGLISYDGVVGKLIFIATTLHYFLIAPSLWVIVHWNSMLLYARAFCFISIFFCVADVLTATTLPLNVFLRSSLAIASAWAFVSLLLLCISTFARRKRRQQKQDALSALLH